MDDGGSGSTLLVAPVATADAFSYEAECVICLVAGPILTTPLRITRCGHNFCTSCLGAWVIKRQPTSAMIPCPMCRAELPDDDIPKELALTLTRRALVEIKLSPGDDEPGLRIGRILPGSLAASAGLRRGMRLLSVQNEAVADGVSLGLIGNHDEPVEIVISDLRPAVDEPSAQPRATTLNPLGACVCCCIVVGQLWQRLMQGPRGRRRFRHACAAIGLGLWLLFCMSIGFFFHAQDSLAREMIRGGCGLNTTATNATDATAACSTAPDAVEALVLFVATVGCFWTVLSSLLMCARSRMVHSEPEVWQRVLDQLASRRVDGWHSTPTPASPWCGPFCCCCSLGAHMLFALGLTHYSLCLPLALPADEDEELGEVGEEENRESGTRHTAAAATATPYHSAEGGGAHSPSNELV